MKYVQLGILFLFFLAATSCHEQKILTDTTPTNNQEVSVTFLQINDFYNIGPSENGALGGAARIATLRNKLLKENPNTYFVLAGDFLNPSLIGTLKVDGQRVKGRQMIETLNHLNLDLVTFGNHEFDIKDSELQARIDESKFDWVSSNVYQNTESGISAFKQRGISIPRNKILEFKNSDGTSVKIGVVAPCLAFNMVKYVHYEDVFESVAQEIEALEAEQVDFIIGLTHLDIEDDLKLAERFPQLKLIMGGHDHDHMMHEVGGCIVAKADADAKSAYVHRIQYNKETKDLNLTSELVVLDQSIAEEPSTNLIVKKWTEIELGTMRSLGFEPSEILTELTEPLDAREKLIRHSPAPFCQLIANSMYAAGSDIDCAILNSGSVRIDDLLTDKLSQYDILSALPFGGSVVQVNLEGSLLKRILDAGWANKGKGGFLQWSRVERTDGGSWKINGKDLDEKDQYDIMITDFLLLGLETNLEFLTKDHEGINSIQSPDPEDKADIKNDIRTCVIDYLKKGGR